MTQAQTMTEEAFEELEELLTSDEVPAETMNLEMLDGYLAGVLASPTPLDAEDWLPAVWSADEESASFASATAMQRALGLVFGYYNEMLASVGEEEGWEAFCYAPEEDGDGPLLGEDWISGFEQAFELWPEDWDEGLPADVSEAARHAIETMLAPWVSDEAASADIDTRLEWLERAAEGARALFVLWREMELPAPQPVEATEPTLPKAGVPGRNDPCPCGSGKKYKKCCGALH